MKVTAFIRKTAKKNDVDTKATIYFRLRDGKKDIKAASELVISPYHWSADRQGFKARVALVAENEMMDLNHKVRAVTRMIEKEYKEDAGSEWLGEVIDKFHQPEKYQTEEELAVYKRGRNAKTVSMAKHATMHDYRHATGFEALMGYLYLNHQMMRLIELVKLGME